MKVPAVNLYRRKTYHNNNKKLLQSLTKPRQYAQKTKHLSKSDLTDEEMQTAIKNLERLNNEIILMGVQACTGLEITKKQESMIVVPAGITNNTDICFPTIEKQSIIIAITNSPKETNIEQIAQKIISEYNDKEIILKVENN